jgi:hypothetical protein
MWQAVLTASLLLAGQVSAGVISDAARLVGRGESTESNMRRYVKSLVEPVERRVATPAVNVTQWDAQTEAACSTALSALNGVASNPSGMAVCYNLPYLDNSTGVFQADLRLYKISDPTGTFANIQSQDVQVGLTYPGATVSAVNASSLKRRGELYSLISWPSIRSEEGIERRQSATLPTMAQVYAFVGQVNHNLLPIPKTTGAVENILVPMVTLTGVDSTGATVNTTLSSTEATFVSGVFAQDSTTITPSKAAVASPIQTLVVAANEPFVVPGLHIIIFPIGGIITGIWAVLGIATVIYGTVGRMRFREQYRRRSARAEKGGQPRI